MALKESDQEIYNRVMDDICEDVARALAPMKLMGLSRDAMAKMCAIAIHKVKTTSAERIADILTIEQASNVDTINNFDYYAEEE